MPATYEPDPEPSRAPSFDCLVRTYLVGPAHVIADVDHTPEFDT